MWSWGTREPLDNYDNLLKFIQLLTDGHGLAYQPEKCDRINLWNCAEDLKPLPRKNLQIYTGAILCMDPTMVRRVNN